MRRVALIGQQLLAPIRNAQLLMQVESSSCMEWKRHLPISQKEEEREEITDRQATGETLHIHRKSLVSLCAVRAAEEEAG